MPSAFAVKLAKIAEKEYNEFLGLHESDVTLANRIKTYWTEIQGDSGNYGLAWSAVFVSFMVKRAGAVAGEFAFSASHSVFVHEAIRRAADPRSAFAARLPTDYAPTVGDIIQNNRYDDSGKPLQYDFAFASTHPNYSSHSAIVVEEGTDGSGRYVRTIGGNESNAIRDKVRRTNSNGILKPNPAWPRFFISVLQNKK